jgi:hypothetical protein
MAGVELVGPSVSKAKLLLLGRRTLQPRREFSTLGMAGIVVLGVRHLRSCAMAGVKPLRIGVADGCSRDHVHPPPAHGMMSGVPVLSR